MAKEARNKGKEVKTIRMTLADFSDEELAKELKRRGWEGELMKINSLKI